MALCIIAYTTKGLLSYLADNDVNAHDIRKIDFVCVKKCLKIRLKFSWFVHAMYKLYHIFDLSTFEAEQPYRGYRDHRSN